MCRGRISTTFEQPWRFSSRFRGRWGVNRVRDGGIRRRQRWPRDSNPRGSQPPYTLSRRVPSAARAGHRDESTDGTGPSWIRSSGPSRIGSFRRPTLEPGSPEPALTTVYVWITESGGRVAVIG